MDNLFDTFILYCKCPKCGKEANVDASMVLTSYPPQYNFSCPHCGHHGYVFCKDTYSKPILPERQYVVIDSAETEFIPQMYQMIADENELKWFFEHVVMKPQVNESYSAVFVSRHKKLTKEEQETIGLTRKESEFLATQTFRLGKFKDALYIDEDNNWTFENFLKRIKRFNVDKGAYTTALGEPIPEKTLAIIFYVNPCDDIKVADALVTQINEVKTAIAKAMLNGKTTIDNLQSYQMFGNLENNLKHFKANQKGTRYWLDFDIDVPKWFKDKESNKIFLDRTHFAAKTIGPFDYLCLELDKRFGKGNYVIIDTSGGYHVLVRTSAIKSNPHDFCKVVNEIYKTCVDTGAEPYLDEKGNCKFECIVNDSQIPGIPLPGTYQYGRPVTVLNKEDFEDVDYDMPGLGATGLLD